MGTVCKGYENGSTSNWLMFKNRFFDKRNKRNVLIKGVHQLNI